MLVLEDITTHPPKGATVRSRKSGNLAKVVARRREFVGDRPIYWITVNTGEKQAEVLLEAVEYPVVVDTPLGLIEYSSDAVLQVGDRVTNDLNWDGTITDIDRSQLSEDGFYYWVHWQEREHHKEKLVAKHPVCGHLRQEIRRKP